MRYIIPLFTLLLVSLQAQQIRIVGTDLFDKTFLDSLRQSAHLEDDDLKMDMKGSRSALIRLEKDEADLAIITVQPGAELPKAPFVAIPVAYQAVLVVVPTDLPISQMNFDQLDTLFCEDAPSSLRAWGDLGTPGKWINSPIVTLITSPDAGLCYDLFRHVALRSPKIRPGVSIFKSNQALFDRMTGSEDGCIGITSAKPAHRKLKILRLARSAQDIAYDPTPENLHSGNYPLKVSFYLVFKKENTPKLMTVLRQLLSDDSIPAWEAQNLIPVPLQVRNQSIFDLEVL